MNMLLLSEPALAEKWETSAEMPQLFAAFLHEPYSLFLDSGIRHPLRGRYSYVTADPFLVVRSKDQRVELLARGTRWLRDGDPFAVLQRLWAQWRISPVSGLPPFQGGAAGYFAYDLCHHLEVLPRNSVDDLGLPDMYIGLYDWVLAHDHQQGRTWLVVTGLPEGTLLRARRRQEWVRERIGTGPAPMSIVTEKVSGKAVGPALPPPKSAVPFLRSNFTREEYLSAIKTAKEYIAAGDIYQVNLSQRFEAELPVDPWLLYQRLRQINPAPFAAYLGFGQVAVISASPEEFLHLEERRVVTRPIKGTRPRGATPEEDQALAQELAVSEKDRAENLMIVDLLRNDLGRVCAVGSVQVPELFALEEHPTVFHLVSTITGELKEGCDAVALLRACFPGGSVTGCPKIRSMEIIDELEPTQRGIYCGAIGYLSFTGAMRTNIVIRTIVVVGRRAYLQVGGAIIADSDPAAEYEETLHKARALFQALGSV